MDYQVEGPARRLLWPLYGEEHGPVDQSYGELKRKGNLKDNVSHLPHPV